MRIVPGREYEEWLIEYHRKALDVCFEVIVRFPEATQFKDYAVELGTIINKLVHPQGHSPTPSPTYLKDSEAYIKEVLTQEAKAFRLAYDMDRFKTINMEPIVPVEKTEIQLFMEQHGEYSPSEKKWFLKSDNMAKSRKP